MVCHQSFEAVSLCEQVVSFFYIPSPRFYTAVSVSICDKAFESVTVKSVSVSLCQQILSPSKIKGASSSNSENFGAALSVGSTGECMGTLDQFVDSECSYGFEDHHSLGHLALPNDCGSEALSLALPNKCIGHSQDKYSALSHPVSSDNHISDCLDVNKDNVRSIRFLVGMFFISLILLQVSSQICHLSNSYVPRNDSPLTDTDMGHGMYEKVVSEEVVGNNCILFVLDEPMHSDYGKSGK